MAALALMMAACSSNDDELTVQPAQQDGKIPFSATIATPSSGATTRTTYTESGTSINVAWKKNDMIALVHNGKKDVVLVETVNSDGSATITGSITVGDDDEDVVLVYPANLVAEATGGTAYTESAYVTDKFMNQGGTLTYIQNNLDIRKGTGKLAVSGASASLKANVSMDSQIAIFKFTTKNTSSDDISVNSLTVFIGTQQYVITPASATNTLYAALPAVSSQKVTFIAKGSDSKTYWVSKPSVTFAAGKYYQSGIKMSQVTYTSATIGVGTVFHVGDTYYADGTSIYFHAKSNFNFINSNGVITLINDGGTYKFQRGSNDSKVDLGISVTGNSDGVYLVSGSGTSGSRFEIAVHTN